MLKCGEDDDGKTIRMKLKYFLKYMKLQTDDSPLYIFDSSFDDREDTKPLLRDYRVPSYFPQDLFELVGEDRRPPYRWFLVGPKRSGTCVHLDPLGTSAWNTLLVGRKRWVLFPPDVPKRIVKGTDHVRPGEDDEAVNYFMDILPRIKKAHAPEVLRCIEFMQYPGDTIFVPGGWWHAVFNVEDTVAVTQNFCSAQNFDRVWRATRKGRKRMAIKWLQKLRETHPHLAERAVCMNREDGFVMMNKDGTPFELAGVVSPSRSHEGGGDAASDLESTVSSAESSSMVKKPKKKIKTKRTREDDGAEDEMAKKRERAELADEPVSKSKKQKKSRME
jgi:histone arginine demethylase JMJD6